MMMHHHVRTSLSDPLDIAEIGPGQARIAGSIGLTLCPGKHQPHAQTGAWARDLTLDLDRIKQWGAAAVVSVIETHELATLGVARLGEEVRARGMQWFHLPVADYHVPADDFVKAWERARPTLLRLIADGKKILTHCKGGLGRTGTVAALLLIEAGHYPPDEAIAIVRRARPKAIETREQEGWLRSRA